jgi:soluble lytic murein transglycosylase-like protein
MSRVLFALLVSLGAFAQALAQEPVATHSPSEVASGASAASAASGTSAASAGMASGSATYAASVPAASSITLASQASTTSSNVIDASAVVNASAADASVASSPVAASGPVSAQAHHLSEVLTEKFGLARDKAEKISTAVLSSASKYSLSPALVLAIISIESRFQEKAHGKNGATGLMQVVPAAHKQLVKNVDLTEPVANINAGAQILHGYIESARGDIARALKSYGGSTKYAHNVTSRVKEFEPGVAASDTPNSH